MDQLENLHMDQTNVCFYLTLKAEGKGCDP